jgi:hypothetical protein
MRILNWLDFADLPEGTLFRKYEPDCFEGLCIKGSTINHDGIPADFFLTYLDNHDGYAHQEGRFKFDYDIQGRDALFDKNQLFAVYEDDDINHLIKVLSLAKGKFCPKEIES